MHIEFIVEDSSGARLIEIIAPKLIGKMCEPHTWRIHSYKGIGHIPKNLNRGASLGRVLLNQLPKLLRGYGKTPGVDAVVVVVDTDRQDYARFLQELTAVREECGVNLNVIYGLAVEEIEAWYFGDLSALRQAYPNAKEGIISSYVQDSICGTWEMLAEALHKGGMASIKKVGWPLPGQLKHEWAANIGPLMDIEINVSPSFCNFRDNMRRLVL